jgi:hypothetical protein
MVNNLPYPISKRLDFDHSKGINFTLSIINLSKSGQHDILGNTFGAEYTRNILEEARAAA